jgi:hypothetical protein
MGFNPNMVANQVQFLNDLFGRLGKLGQLRRLENHETLQKSDPQGVDQVDPPTVEAEGGSLR